MAKQIGWGRRCDFGCESWPDHDDYSVCPVCDQETTRYSNLRPLDEDEAKKRKAYVEFEAYYEKHCEERNQGVEGPLSEEVVESLSASDNLRA